MYLRIIQDIPELFTNAHLDYYYQKRDVYTKNEIDALLAELRQEFQNALSSN